MDFRHESQFSLVVSDSEQAFDDVCTVIEAAGAVEIGRDYAMAGSQEIGYRRYRLGGQLFVVQDETYIGVSLFGPRKLVEDLASIVVGHIRT